MKIFYDKKLGTYAYSNGQSSVQSADKQNIIKFLIETKPHVELRTTIQASELNPSRN